MISFYEYIALETNQRAEELWENGGFLTNVAFDDVAYSLYSLFDFYVEVTMIENEISEITPFKQGERLEKYLGVIDISDLKSSFKPSNKKRKK